MNTQGDTEGETDACEVTGQRQHVTCTCDSFLIFQVTVSDELTHGRLNYLGSD